MTATADVATLGALVGRLLGQLTGAVDAMLELLDLENGTHDEAAEVITRTRDVAAAARDLKNRADQRILEWFLANRHGHRDVVIGDLRYFGDRGKSEHVRDLPTAFGALARAEVGELIHAATYGDEELAEEILRGIEALAAAVVSNSGLKVGACRAVLAKAAEADLRAQPTEPTPDAIEQAASALFDRHFETRWPDRLDDQPEAKALGVANMRFLMGATSDRQKKDLAAMLERAGAARQRALAAETGGVEVVVPRDAALCASCLSAMGRIVPGGEVDQVLRELADRCTCPGGCRAAMRPLGRAEGEGAPGSWRRAVADAGVGGGA